jgi:hypothetical protein
MAKWHEFIKENSLEDKTKTSSLKEVKFGNWILKNCTSYKSSDALSTFCSVFKHNEASKKRYEILKKYIEEYDKNQQK